MADVETAVPGVILAVTSDAIPHSSYAPFLSSEIVKLGSSKYLVKVLRDTGSSMSL